MTGAEIDALLERTRTEHGPWTAHAIDLGEGRVTLGDGPHGSASADGARLARMLQIVQDLGTPAGRPLRVLDLGALEGLFAVELARRGADVVAVEARAGNAARIRAAREALGLDRLEVVEADVRDLEALELGRFDLVLCLGLLYHLDEDGVLGLVPQLARMCDRAAIFDTHVALQDGPLAAADPAGLRVDPGRDLGPLRPIHDARGRAYEGRTFFEHTPDLTLEERLASPWASVQPSSFWLTETSLRGLLRDSGFGGVYAALEPEVYGPVDRVWLVAHAGGDAVAQQAAPAAAARPDPPVPFASPQDRPDALVCLAIIDWEFRWQRPQQLLSRLAQDGTAVLNVVLPRGDGSDAGTARATASVVAPDVTQVIPHPARPLDLYGAVPDEHQTRDLADIVEESAAAAGLADPVLLVQLASWGPVALELRDRHGWPVVYDCMDEWDGFPGVAPALPQAERALVAQADAVTVSARRLWDRWAPANGRIALVRNGADPAHYADPPPPEQRPLHGVEGPIVGHMGAIAAWVDVALVERTARARPDWTFVLVGGVFDVDVEPLRALANVRLEGQQPYALMPAYVADFDACLIPFVVDAVTAAVDPVKLWEYFSLGKPVVSTPLPEVAAHRHLLYEAADPGEVVERLEQALAEDDEALRERRRAVADDGTWERRAAALGAALRRARRTGYRPVRHRALGALFHDVGRVLVVGPRPAVDELVGLAPELLRPAGDGPAPGAGTTTAVLATDLAPQTLHAAAACRDALAGSAAGTLWALHEPGTATLPVAAGAGLLERVALAAAQAGFAVVDWHRVLWSPPDRDGPHAAGIVGRVDVETAELLVGLSPLDAPATVRALQDQLFALRRQQEALHHG